MPVVLWWQTSFPRAAQPFWHNLKACCWDSRNMWHGRVSPKFRHLFCSLYFDCCHPCSPCFISCSHSCCVLCSSHGLHVSKQPQGLGQRQEPWVGWHLYKYPKTAGGMLLIAPQLCMASSRWPVATSSVPRVFSDMCIGRKVCNPLAGDCPLLLLLIIA